MAQKHVKGRAVYRSDDDFGGWNDMDAFLRKLKHMIPTISDFGAAAPGDSPMPLTAIIQPPYYRAPEVILKTGFSYSADVWSFGMMVR